MWIKICGVTTPDDARMISDAGVEAIGLNFFPGSKRFVDLEQARLIRAAIPDSIDVVGVFVNSSPAEVAHTATEAQLTTVQFHGDESVQTIGRFRELSPQTSIIRALRMDDTGTEGIERQLDQLKSAGIRLKAVLVDAFVAGEYGGTGHMIRLDAFDDVDRSSWPPLILAGGLNSDTVCKAIQHVSPWGVDTASGVEDAPGRKSDSRVRDFVAAARQCRT
jgi:phosphoribosylanthranilate isomerase